MSKEICKIMIPTIFKNKMTKKKKKIITLILISIIKLIMIHKNKIKLTNYYINLINL